VEESHGIGPDSTDAEAVIHARPQFSFTHAAGHSSQIDPAPVGVVAFVGRCLKGPVNEAVPVASFVEFQQKFGGLWSGSTLPHAVEQFFEHGGEQALIVRVVSAGKAPSIDLPTGDDRLVLVGVCPGSREYLRASVDYDGIDPQDSDLFNLVVQRLRAPGSELVEAQETFRRVSVYPGSAREVGRMLAASTLVRVAGLAPQGRPLITRGADARTLVGYRECHQDGDDGQLLSDYDLIGSEAARSGVFALQEGLPFNFLYFPPPAPDRDLGISALVVGARFCRSRHAMLLVDPPLSWKTAHDALEGIRDWPFHSHDALMYFPRLSAMDRLHGRMDSFAPGAAAVGLLLRDDRSAPGVWSDEFEPALLRPPAQPSVWVDRLQRAQLVQRGVNSLRATRSAARDVAAPHTLAGEFSTSQDERLLSARRFALFVSASIERGTRWVALEGNSPRSRDRVCRQVERFLLQLAEAGAFAGQERNRHFFVICDDRLNGALEHANGEFRLVYGYQSRHGSARQAWLVVHRAGGSQTRAVSLNQLALAEMLAELLPEPRFDEPQVE
jgi:uncharacterized protein